MSSGFSCKTLPEWISWREIKEDSWYAKPRLPHARTHMNMHNYAILYMMTCIIYTHYTQKHIQRRGQKEMGGEREGGGGQNRQTMTKTPYLVQCCSARCPRCWPELGPCNKGRAFLGEGLTDSHTEYRQRWICGPITSTSCTAQWAVCPDRLLLSILDTHGEVQEHWCKWTACLPATYAGLSFTVDA